MRGPADNTRAGKSGNGRGRSYGLVPHPINARGRKSPGSKAGRPTGAGRIRKCYTVSMVGKSMNAVILLSEAIVGISILFSLGVLFTLVLTAAYGKLLHQRGQKSKGSRSQVEDECEDSFDHARPNIQQCSLSLIRPGSRRTDESSKAIFAHSSRDVGDISEQEHIASLSFGSSSSKRVEPHISIFSAPSTFHVKRFRAGGSKSSDQKTTDIFVQARESSE